jgi:hypothetical protein
MPVGFIDNLQALWGESRRQFLRDYIANGHCLALGEAEPPGQLARTRAVPACQGRKSCRKACGPGAATRIMIGP